MLAVCCVVFTAVCAQTARADVIQNVLLTWRDLASRCERPPYFANEDGALLAVAMFEAINAIEKKYAPFGDITPVKLPASPNVAAAQAAHDVLIHTCPANASLYTDALARALGEIKDTVARANGVAVGRRAAASVMAARSQSGVGRADLLPNTSQPGVYVQTAEYIGTNWASAQPWAMDKPEQFRAPPLPSLTSDIWRRDIDELRRVGGLVSDNRTAEQTELARYWGQTGVRKILPQLIGQPGRTLVDDARFLALAEIAWADAYISLFEGKYHYAFWRPITAIRHAAVNGNLAARSDSIWRPLLETPPHPEYPCGHCASVAAVGTVIAAEFGEQFPSVVIERGAFIHRYNSAQQYIDAVSISRLYAGAHPQFSIDAGKASGVAVARLVMQRYFKK